MNEWQDLPPWLNKLVRGRPRSGDVFLKLEGPYKDALAQRGVTFDMLKPIGDEDRPTGIGVKRPGDPWTHAELRYFDDEPQVMDALDDLIRAIDRSG